MTYTPNPTWTSNTPISTTAMNNLETQYEEACAYLAAHNHDDLYYTKTYMDSTFWSTANDGPGSGADADLLYVSGGNLHATSLQGMGIDAGIIILWYGSVGSIPAGWVLCDGNNATPDLRGKFIVGAGNTYNPGVSGGSATFSASGTLTIDAHILTVAEMASHRHPWKDMYGDYGNALYEAAYNAGGTLATLTGNTSSAGSGSGHTHEGSTFTATPVACLPYFYALCYVMKS